MKTALSILLTLLALQVGQALATTAIIAPCPIGGETIEEQWKEASAIVVATAESVSIRPLSSGVVRRRTVLWRTNESWKGPYKGSTFTTRDVLTCRLEDRECTEHWEWDITSGRSMLLFLSGHEPYSIGAKGCPGTGYLEESILQLEKLIRLRMSWRSGA